MFESALFIRDYAPGDRDACLAVFRSNMPDYFLPHEVAVFEAFLDNLPGPYLVIVERESIVACGGLALERESGVASLCWGMVRRDRHRKGIGRLLLQARIERIRLNPNARRVRIDTSQHTQAFFERAGFRATEVKTEGHGPGLDSVRMVLDLSGGT